MLSDNFCYYVYHKSDIKKGFFVDVSEPEKLQAFAKVYGIESITNILTTHKHADHSGGNKSLLEAIPDLKVYGGAHDNIPGCTNPINDGDIFEINGIKIKCMHTPCHTKGHILYFCESAESVEDTDIEKVVEGNYQHVKNIDRCIFTGDTIFIGGCGRFFEGTAD
jgi:hydroxyacylglutathione hydrolase